ncbi:Fibrinogen, alpha/beta/gamma chain, C-terminal globular domain and Fibrinogen, alpha/beta/gamma chain, C-terminal globular, subdomain 2 and Fibrinogen, alpha/beta/gamma chain, C-terminal globular, subdomain 1-containing protein [Strongyloides ratti]|uniref:Fibrinogen C-terminal domain-containing protein n=1 Tax=Strongyloides ratti TaxID=34506 RepID=A0A090LTR7_STRRB|nr:Fibrinogen, alpha/beta/gamma chain, C-terminal globular domain and Fibrinogen, alpha/beta/gamma chain, C-terminal globular, subdomain 2 and Fibrinogen, alpha/beta/gamma chain, C-terminal globular, subdomain 1-containing protein [Strongyloides ratti]CEF71612.1 Fibrinogen, alpha/beta/gamma chain, C-terminal globular domain and Fibrinogen, alpha/beta/gamma chain, C-terminal globular, subdomain 2 and Fibrinogen, alpha/beta/gamma chain, C-terminal globular, subdomain 1-containing protein [Strongyloi
MRQIIFGVVVISLLLPYILGKYSLTLLLQEYDVGMGYLNNGSHCNPFWFAGIKCNIQLKICISLLSDTTSVAKCQNENGNPSNQWIDLGQVTNNSNSIQFSLTKYNNWINPLFITSNDDTFTGFSLSLEAYNINGNEFELIDSYTYQFAGPSDINSTLTKISWIVNGPVSIQTTPKPQLEGIFDCTDSPTTTGKLTLNYTDTTFDVYCDPGNNGASYTVIQARGPKNSSTDFNKKFNEYENLIGTIEKNGNYWIGLKNINKITNNGRNYDMRIDLCCGDKQIKTLYYTNVKIGDSTTNYTLSCNALDRGIGLAFGPGGTYDINMSFSTPEYYTGNTNGLPEEYCDILTDPSDPSIKWGTGGWWYGSCGNNLNGKYIPNKDGNCSTIDLTKEDSIKTSTTGIEMATHTTQIGKYQFDGISYDKMNMKYILILLTLISLGTIITCYTLTISLSTLNVTGYLENGKNCSKFADVGIECNPQPRICIEKLTILSNDTEHCIGSYFQDLNIFKGNKITFDTQKWYNSWYNPQIFKNLNTYEGFRLKLFIYNVDGTDYQKIGSLLWEFQKTNTGSQTPIKYSNTNSANDKTIEEFSLSYSVQ